MTENERITLFDDFMCGIVPINVRTLLISRGFFKAPASTKYHGSYEGGLFDHSLEVAKTLVDLTEKNNLEWQRKQSPYIVGMFHDLCKIDNYLIIQKDDETSFIYNPEPILKGLGDKSVMLLSEFYTLTVEEILCIRYHMGAFTDKEEWKDYTRAVNNYPTVLWTHQADMLASHVKGV